MYGCLKIAAYRYLHTSRNYVRRSTPSSSPLKKKKITVNDQRNVLYKKSDKHILRLPTDVIKILSFKKRDFIKFNSTFILRVC